MTPNAIYSKSGKGVQEASGKTSLLSRGDRAVLSAFDGRLSVSDVADRVGKPFDNTFQRLILQLERDGYIREVAAGTAPTPPTGRHSAIPARPAAGAPRPAAAAPKGGGGGSDLDFTIAIPASPPPKPRTPAAPPPVDPSAKARAEVERKAQEDNMARARREAEERAQKERDRVKFEAEARVRFETEARLRAEAGDKAQSDTEARIRAEAEAKVGAVRDAAARIAADAKARAEAEMRATLEAERAKIREEADRALREAEELRHRLEVERQAREAEERKRRDLEELRRKEEDERRAREELERMMRGAEEGKRKEEEERRVREERTRAIREMQEGEASEKRERQEAERKAKEREKPPAPAPASDDGGFGALMADLDSFSDRDDADKKAKEDAERNEKARKEREQADRTAKAQAEEARKEAEEKAANEERRRRKEEEERAVREEAEERAKRAAEDRKRREREAEAAAALAGSGGKSDDIGVSDDDLDMDDVKRDQDAVSKESRKAAREREREAKEREREARERAKEREREAKRAAKAGAAPAPAATAYKPFRRKQSWGKPIAITLFILLAAGIGAIHVMSVSTADYEKAASEAIGRPVKIGAAHLSLVSGIELKLERVSIGGAKIASVRAFPEVGSLFDDKKAFSRIELEGVSLEQRALGEVLSAKLKGRNFSVERLSAKQVKLVGPLPLPVLEAEMRITPAGSIGVTSVRGPDNLAGKLTPSGSGVEFDVTASGFTLPFMPEVTLSTFAMKGSATNDSARIESWGGASLDGAISGTASVRWGATWSLEGVMTLRGINAALFAPALLPEGKAEGTGRFSMNGPDPTNFKGKGRAEGTFSMNKGVLGGFDLSRAILTGGRQASGRTPFTEMSGQALFDRGTIALRNVSFRAGAMNAGASADITAQGALSGRIVAEIRTSAQNLRTTVNIGGTVTEPLVK